MGDGLSHVTSSEDIMLQMHAERSDAQLAESDVGFIFNTQQAITRVLVQDGETVVIGGLTVTEKTDVRSGIPLLMDLPLLGKLFRVDPYHLRNIELCFGVFGARKIRKTAGRFFCGPDCSQRW